MSADEDNVQPLDQRRLVLTKEYTKLFEGKTFEERKVLALQIANSASEFASNGATLFSRPHDGRTAEGLDLSGEIPAHQKPGAGDEVKVKLEFAQAADKNQEAKVSAVHMTEGGRKLAALLPPPPPRQPKDKDGNEIELKTVPIENERGEIEYQEPWRYVGATSAKAYSDWYWKNHQDWWGPASASFVAETKAEDLTLVAYRYDDQDEKYAGKPDESVFFKYEIDAAHRNGKTINGIDPRQFEKKEGSLGYNGKMALAKQAINRHLERKAPFRERKPFSGKSSPLKN